jgi:hypothetical protein
MKRRLASLALAAVGILLAGLLLAFPQDATPPAAPTGVTVTPIAEVPVPAFGAILAAYLAAVVCNRAFNWLWSWGRNVKAGPFAYFSEHGPMLLATMLLHVPLFALWYSGAILPALNAAIGGMLAGADAIPGVDLSGIALPAVVTPGVTLIYGWPIDSVTSRIGMLIGSRFALFGGGAPKETTT